MGDAPPLLTAETVGSYLRGRGVLGPGDVTARALSGGVSNVVLLAEQGERRAVVKQALSKLRVADDWYAEPSRSVAEGRALRLAATITPGAVPQVLDIDESVFVLTIEAAPPSWTTWKQQLMAGCCDPRVAAWLGTTLRAWQEATTGEELPRELESVQVFRQLRIDPYFGVSARRCPELADKLTSRAEEILARRQCLVSGDFSPKNVLAGPGGGWVIDLEVAHRGDPAFDVAFMLSHLLLKAVHLPGLAGQLHACGREFLAAYGGAGDPAHLCGVTGCLLLARVAGSSPAEYLTAAEQDSVRVLAAKILRDEPDSVEALWSGI